MPAHRDNDLRKPIVERRIREVGCLFSAWIFSEEFFQVLSFNSFSGQTNISYEDAFGDAKYIMIISRK